MLVIVGGLIGILAGTIVAWAMMTQFKQWNGISPPVYVPWTIFAVVSVVAMFAAILSTCIPLKALLKARISAMLRGWSVKD